MFLRCPRPVETLDVDLHAPVIDGAAIAPLEAAGVKSGRVLDPCDAGLFKTQSRCSPVGRPGTIHVERKAKLDVSEQRE
jgi:hypothetical protein